MTKEVKEVKEVKELTQEEKAKAVVAEYNAFLQVIQEKYGFTLKAVNVPQLNIVPFVKDEEVK
jgi:hypothetical protein